MSMSLFGYLIMNVALLLLATTLLTEIRPLRKILKRQARSVPNQLLLGGIFGLLSISGTYTGLSFQGAVVNTRVVSTVAAGLVGGWLPGLLAGAIGGLHRYFYEPGGFTSLACAIGTFLFGVLGGLCCRWYSRLSRRKPALVGITVVSEAVQCCLILALARPFSAAVALEKAILLPKMVINSLGLALFMEMLDRLNRSLTLELAEQQTLALHIAQKCLPYLREGMEDHAALQKAADTVREILPDFQTALTDRESVLAAGGVELAEKPLPSPAGEALERRETVVCRPCRELSGVAVPADSAAIAVPLVWDGDAVGTLLLVVPLGPNLILEADVRVAEALAGTFSTMLRLGELQHEVQLRQQAELRALQAQMDPHLLFNSLNTISALCLTDPDRARDTILVLARYFRQTLTINEPFVTLAQEMDNVENYLKLTNARFEGMVHVTKELPEDLTRLRLPPLVLQPLVENAVRHGYTAVDDRYVFLEIRQDAERACVRVTDRGPGFPPEVLARLNDPKDRSYTGLFNVRKRLMSAYGDRCRFTVDSSDTGSTVAFSIPLDPPRALWDVEGEEE